MFETVGTEGRTHAELLPQEEFTRALREVARRHRETREGYGLVLFVPRERHGNPALAAALSVGAAGARALGMLEGDVFGVLLEKCASVDVDRLVARVERLTAGALEAGGLAAVHVVSAARVSGTRKIEAWRMRRSTLECLIHAFGMAQDMGPQALTGATFVR